MRFCPQRYRYRGISVVLCAAAGALRQLTSAPREAGGQRAMASASGIGPLVSLVRNARAPTVQAHAMHALCNLAECSDTNRAVAAEYDAIVASVFVLGQPTSDAEMRAAAASTLFSACEVDRRALVEAHSRMHSLHDLSERFGDGLADSDVIENDLLILLVARRVLLLTNEPGRRFGEGRGDTIYISFFWLVVGRARLEKKFVRKPVRDRAAGEGFR